MPSESKSDSEDEKGGEGKGEGKNSGERTMGRVCSDDDYDTSSSSYDDVVRIRLGELAVVQRSDGTWRYAILDGRDGDKMEFQVDSGENDYKLFCPEGSTRSVVWTVGAGASELPWSPRARGGGRCVGLTGGPSTRVVRVRGFPASGL